MQNATNTKYYGWILFILGALFYGYEYALRIMPSLVMPQMIAHFATNHAGFGYLAASYYYAYVLFQIPAGILIDRYGAIRLMITACLTCALGALLFASTHVFAFAMVARFAIGAGSVFGFVGTLSIASVYLPARYFPVVAGITSAFGTISAMMADISLTHVLQQVGWDFTNYIVVGIGLSIVALLAYFNSKVRTVEQSHESIGYIELFKKSLMFLRMPQFWLNAFIGCLIYLPTTIFAELWGIPFLRIARGFTEHEAAYAVSFIFLGYTIGAPISGILSQYIHRQKILITSATLASCLAASILYAPTIALNGVMMLLFLLGLAYGAQSLIFAVAKDLVPVRLSGSVLAFTNMIVMFGGVFLQPIVGHIIDFMSKDSQINVLHNYQVALAIMPIGVLMSAVLSYCLLRISREDAR